MINRSKIIVGTGRLGRSESPIDNFNRIDAINYILERGGGIHISPTYGSSFDKLKSLNLQTRKVSKIISKIDFSKRSLPEVQLHLTSKLLGGKSFEVQIAGDIRNIILNQPKGWENFVQNLYKLKSDFNIGSYFLTPLYHDTDPIIELIKKTDLKFNFALHYSLVEAEFRSSLFKFIDETECDVLALRAFGENTKNFGNWFSPLGTEEKSRDILNLQEANFKELINKNGLQNVQARLLFALKNPQITFAALSFSSISQARGALELLATDYRSQLIEELVSYNLDNSNILRKGLGFRYPESLNVLQNHNIFLAIKVLLKAKHYKEIFELLNNKIIAFLFKILRFVKRKLF